MKRVLLAVPPLAIAAAFLACGGDESPLPPPVEVRSPVTLAPDADNTLYENPTGDISNGRGAYLFAGRTNEIQNSIRRALVHFNVSAAGIPTAASIDSVFLTLDVNKTASASEAAVTSLHRVLAGWGEGTSDADGEEGAGALATTDDATWLHRFFDTQLWSAQGGDFSAPRASVQLGAAGPHTWGSTPAMISDVQSWRDDPAKNFGWILVGNESRTGTARRFASRHYPTAANRPKLVVYFSNP